MYFDEGFFTKKRIILLLILAFFVFYFVPFVWLQSVYLSLGLETKKLVSVDYAVYEASAPGSVVDGMYALFREDDPNTFASFEKENSYASVVVYSFPSKCSEMLYLHFEDGSVMACLVSEDSLGLAMGRVWIKNRFLPKLITQAKESSKVDK